MCQLLSISAKLPVKFNTELEEFFSNSITHKHGWGYADFTKSDMFIMHEIFPAYESEYIEKMLSQPFYVQNALFHIRYATIGTIELENCHPLTCDDVNHQKWTIVHNGTIFNSEKIDSFFTKQKGTTDTERLLLYIVDKINEATLRENFHLSDKFKFKIIEDIINEIACGNKINIILYDGKFLYVHANSRSGGTILGEAGKNDFLYELDLKEGKVFSTKALDNRNWIPVQLNTLLIYDDGILVYKAHPHECEYIESQEDIKYLYTHFSQL
ncbi:MAG: class II glutamine amidotransferase [Methanobrevibacter sp.]|jgi:glutamine amidotransferase|nr:class II glutamine amidotransferase [Methanobrevibacter sp.]